MIRSVFSGILSPFKDFFGIFGERKINRGKNNSPRGKNPDRANSRLEDSHLGDSHLGDSHLDDSYLDDSHQANSHRKSGFSIKKFPGSFGRMVFELGKKRPMLAGLIGLAAVLFIFLIVILALNSGKNRIQPIQNAAIIPSIPSEELFLPSEPDFLPDYLYEREKKNFWSLDDIRVYWEIPGNPEQWRREISSAVDKLMEGVP